MNTRILLVHFGLFGILYCCQAIGSEDPIFVDYRKVDPTGGYYVVVRRLGGPIHETTSGPVEILVAEHRVGSPPVEHAEGYAELIDAPNRPLLYATVVRSTVGVRDGDRIIGRMELSDPPRKLLISTKQLGIVCVDEHGMNHKVKRGPAVRVYSMSGNLRFQKNLNELFSTEEIAQFETGSYGIDWFREAWIDEIQKEIVIIAAEERKIENATYGLGDNNRVRLINLKTGEIRKGSKDEIIQAIATKNPTGFQPAIKLAAQMKIHSAIPLLTKAYESSNNSKLRALIKSALDKLNKSLE